MASGADFYVLPEGCIANILSLTTPPDACRLSLISSLFRSAAESDAVWERYLPSDYLSIIARSVDSSLSVLPLKKKQLYFHLCDNHLLIDEGKKSFSLDKWSGKKCYMIAASELAIIWGDTPYYWSWISLPESRFAKVAKLLNVCWLEICGKINTNMLSPETTYTVYLVCKFANASGFYNTPVDISVGIVGSESCSRTVYLDPDNEHKQVARQLEQNLVGHLRHRRLFRPNIPILVSQPSMSRERDGRYPKQRGDRWLEIELGEYFNEGGEDGELEVRLKEVKRLHWKRGLIIEGIEIRPKKG